MIKLTTGELCKAFESLKLITKEQLPIKLSFWVMRTMGVLESDYLLYQNQRREIIKKHAILDDRGEILIVDGCQIQLRPDAVIAYQEMQEALLSVELEVNVLPLSIEILIDSGLIITPQNLAHLNKFLITD